MLRGIEKLGSTSGYQSWLSTPKKAKLSLAALQRQDFPNTIPVVGDFWAALIYEGLSLSTNDGHSCSGLAWGFGVEYMDGIGALLYSDLDTLMSKDDDFYITAAADEEGAITIFFIIDGVVQANVALAGEGVVAAVRTDGTCSWSG